MRYGTITDNDAEHYVEFGRIRDYAVVLPWDYL